MRMRQAHSEIDRKGYRIEMPRMQTDFCHPILSDRGVEQVYAYIETKFFPKGRLGTLLRGEKDDGKADIFSSFYTGTAPTVSEPTLAARG